MTIRICKQLVAVAVACCALFAASCGVYTFSGSTLPANLKTVDVPLFANRTVQPGIAESVTQELTTNVLSSNLLRIVPSGGDATIAGTVLSYSNQPYSYGAAEARQVDVQSYEVTVTAEVRFTDNKAGKDLYKGTVTGSGIYDFVNQTESDGVKLAIKKIIDQVMQNSVQGW